MGDIQKVAKAICAEENSKYDDAIDKCLLADGSCSWCIQKAKDIMKYTDTIEGCLEIITALRHVVTDRDNELTMQKRWKEEARHEVMDLKSKVSELRGQL